MSCEGNFINLGVYKQRHDGHLAVLRLGQDLLGRLVDIGRHRDSHEDELVDLDASVLSQDIDVDLSFWLDHSKDRIHTVELVVAALDFEDTTLIGLVDELEGLQSTNAGEGQFSRMGVDLDGLEKGR